MAYQNRRRKTAIILLVILLCGLTAGISMAGQDNNSGNYNLSAFSGFALNGTGNVKDTVYDRAYGTTANKSGKVRKLTLQEAVNLAMENHPEIKAISQDVLMREQDFEKAHYYADKIKDAEDKAEYGEDMLRLLREQLALIPDPNDPAYKPTYDYLTAQIAEIEAALKEAEPYRIDNYENAKIAYLYEKQAETGLKITKLAEKVVRQKISLLVSKQYFDAIKYRKIEEVKKLAYERAVRQAEAAQQSYEVGFRPKDDFLLARAQAELMKADYQKASMEAENAETELKATIGMDQTVKLELAEWKEDSLRPDLERDLKQGLEKRLEIQKAAGELEVAKLGFEIAQKYLGPGTVDYEQAKIGVAKAEVELNRQKTAVEKEIREAYQNLHSTSLMKESVAGTVEKARESASIAEYRYREGYGIPSPILKALNAEDLAGTTVEVLAAEEKLLEIEEKVIEINYSYNLAKANYLFSIGEGL